MTHQDLEDDMQFLALTGRLLPLSQMRIVREVGEVSTIVDEYICITNPKNGAINYKYLKTSHPNPELWLDAWANCVA